MQARHRMLRLGSECHQVLFSGLSGENVAELLLDGISWNEFPFYEYLFL